MNPLIPILLFAAMAGFIWLVCAGAAQINAKQPRALADPEPRQLPARPLNADFGRSRADRGGVVFHNRING